MGLFAVTGPASLKLVGSYGSDTSWHTSYVRCREPSRLYLNNSTNRLTGNDGIPWKKPLSQELPPVPDFLNALFLLSPVPFESAVLSRPPVELVHQMQFLFERQYIGDYHLGLRR